MPTSLGDGLVGTSRRPLPPSLMYPPGDSQPQDDHKQDPERYPAGLCVAGLLGYHDPPRSCDTDDDPTFGCRSCRGGCASRCRRLRSGCHRGRCRGRLSCCRGGRDRRGGRARGWDRRGGRARGSRCGRARGRRRSGGSDARCGDEPHRRASVRGRRPEVAHEEHGPDRRAEDRRPEFAFSSADLSSARRLIRYKALLSWKSPTWSMIRGRRLTRSPPQRAAKHIS